MDETNSQPTKPSPWGPRDTARLLTCGFLGGAGTIGLQPLIDSFRTHQFPTTIQPAFVVWACLLGGLGALMVWIFRETNMWKAILLGLSLPSFAFSLGSTAFNSQPAGSSSSGGGEGNAGGTVGLFSFVLPEAYAQQGAEGSRSSTAPHSVQITCKGQAFSYTAEIQDEGGKGLGQYEVSSKQAGSYSIQSLPAAARTVQITAGQAQATASLNFASDGTAHVAVEGADFARQFGLAQAFGKTAELIPRKLTASAGSR